MANYKSFGKSELAQLYFDRPVSDCRARAWLMAEIANHPRLVKKLEQLGYNKRQRIFSRKQVGAIFEELGLP